MELEDAGGDGVDRHFPATVPFHVDLVALFFMDDGVNAGLGYPVFGNRLSVQDDAMWWCRPTSRCRRLDVGTTGSIERGATFFLSRPVGVMTSVVHVAGRLPEDHGRDHGRGRGSRALRREPKAQCGIVADPTGSVIEILEPTGFDGLIEGSRRFLRGAVGPASSSRRTDV